MKNLGSLVMLLISVFVELVVLSYVKKHSYESNRRLIQGFMRSILCMVGWSFGLILQILVINLFSDEYARFIDYIFVYPFIAFVPVVLFFFISTIKDKNFKFKPIHILLLIIPIIDIIVIATNDYHHLFYEFYSTDISVAQFGPYYTYVYLIFNYGLLAYDIILFLKSSIKSTSVFSVQTLLIFTGIMIPLSVNFVGMINVIPISIYATPISFSISIIIWGIAIFKYDFLNISPIALRNIVNQMSDAYLVLNIDYVISDCNYAFEKVFKTQKKNLIGQNFYSLKFKDKLVLLKGNIGNYLEEVQTSGKIYQIDAYLADKSRYFNIEISSLVSDYKCVGILILFKDTTQHIKDMETIKNNQNILMERERLATLGQMIGGIAHNLKTPIMSIAGAMEGLQDLVTEYDESIDDSEVTKDDHHQIASEMKEWIVKVNSYDSYMSDVITAVKGQTVSFNDNSLQRFKIEELLNNVNILMKHELKSSLTTLNIDCKIDKNTALQGNINSLVQVINNLISNAIQAYGDKQNQSIDLTISQKDNNIVISVRDYGSGIPKDVQEKLFSKMITTKGHKGTGLGLFMSYSTIKGHFNGDLNFTTTPNEGTTFNIVLPKND